jgi:3-dehydroquinate synthase
VAIGMVAEADLSVHLGLCKQDVAARIRGLVQAAGLPDRMPDTSFAALWRAMQHDKKVVGGKVMGVWPIRLGEVVMRPLEAEACADWHATLSGSNSARQKRRIRRA